MDMGELLLDQGAEGHGGEDLLLQHDRDADHVRLLGLKHRLDQLLEDVAVHVHLLVVYGLDDFVRGVDLVGEIGLHRRHADAGRRIDQRNGLRDFAEDLNRPL